MPTEQGMQGERSDIRRASPVELLLLRERIVREARTTRAAAIGNAIGRALAAALRWVRLLSTVCHEAFALRDVLMPARQRSRMQHPNHYQ